MKFKLIVALVNPEITEKVIESAKTRGATGDVIIPGRGTGVSEKKIFGISLVDKTDVILFVVEEHATDKIIKGFNEDCAICEPGNGIAFVLSIDRVAGLDHQINTIKDKLRNEHL